MRWDAVLEAITTRIAEDTGLVGVYGESIRKMGTHAFSVHSLDYFVVSYTEGELWEPMLVQFSQWTRSMNDLVISERRLRSLFNHENIVIIEGVPMWAQFEDGGDLTGPETEGYYGAASRYRFTPVRERLLPGRSS